MFDVQVAGADTGQGNSNYGIPFILQYGLRLIQQCKLSLIYIGVGEHSQPPILLLCFFMVAQVFQVVNLSESDRSYRLTPRICKNRYPLPG